MTVLALDLGGSHIGCGVSKDGEVLASSSICSDARSLRMILPQLQAELLRICQFVDVQPESCDGIGIGFPGNVSNAPVVTNNGNILCLPLPSSSFSVCSIDWYP